MKNPLALQIRNWFAFYTKPRHEFKAAAQLELAKFEYYLPTVTRLKQWSDRKKKVTEPLLSSYIFVHANEKERLNALQLDSIVCTVSFKGIPARIPDWQIESLRKMMESGADIKISNEIKIGTRVKVIDGPLQGVEGVVYRDSNNQSMLAISIDIVNRSIIAEIHASDVKVIRESKEETIKQ